MPSAGTPSAGDRSSIPTGPAGSRGRFTTLTGQVEAGVEAGCLVLTSGGKTYNLLGGGARGLRPGQQVEVEGAPDDTMLTTCQQGIPFLVTAFRMR